MCVCLRFGGCSGGALIGMSGLHSVCMCEGERGREVKVGGGLSVSSS